MFLDAFNDIYKTNPGGESVSVVDNRSIRSIPTVHCVCVCVCVCEGVRVCERGECVCV